LERRRNVLVPRETTGKAVKQYKSITNKHIPLWAVERYNPVTADLDGMEALVSESVLK
jgi:hypothetical protein